MLRDGMGRYHMFWMTFTLAKYAELISFVRSFVIVKKSIIGKSRKFGTFCWKNAAGIKQWLDKYYLRSGQAKQSFVNSSPNSV